MVQAFSVLVRVVRQRVTKLKRFFYKPYYNYAHKVEGRPRRGVIYIAFGEKYVHEAIFSAQSVKRYMPDLSVTLFTDRPVDSSCFDGVQLIDASHIRCKVDQIYKSPYDLTLYLDSDTMINHDISEMFEILTKYDIALVHDFARRRNRWCKVIPEYAKIPYAFPEFGGGVILFKKSEQVKQFFELWESLFCRYRELTHGWDQATLRIALWSSNIKIHTLPIEYNVRSTANRDKANKQIQSGEEPEMLKPRIFHWHGLNDPNSSMEPYRY